MRIAGRAWCEARLYCAPTDGVGIGLGFASLAAFAFSMASAFSASFILSHLALGIPAPFRRASSAFAG